MKNTSWAIVGYSYHNDYVIQIIIRWKDRVELQTGEDAVIIDVLRTPFDPLAAFCAVVNQLTNSEGDQPMASASCN